MQFVIGNPGFAGVLQKFIINSIHDLVSSFQKLQRKPFSSMPANMTMHQPRSGIIRLKSDYQMPVARPHCRIPARRVLSARGPIPGTRPLRNNKEIMFVQVEWVADSFASFDVQIKPLVRFRKRDYGTEVGKCRLAIIYLHQCGIFP